MTDAWIGERDRDRKIVARWLLVCCAMVALMVVIGGVTRLTRSGLSIVEWQPVIGVLPPLNEAEWQAMFDKYRQTPEYQQVNKGMSLEAFKGIFWWEYLHRLLGRLVGLVYLIPFLWFIVRRQVDGALAWKLAGVFVLGGMQGVAGWLMVQSGLIDDPKVHPARLAIHLGLAFIIFAAMLWIALGLRARHAIGGLTSGERRLASHANWTVLLVFLMVLLGALVAGLRAGSAYNTFPLMNGHVIPPEILSLEPWTRNFIYNMAMVQFNHRLLAYVLIIAIGWLWLRVRKSHNLDRARAWVNLLLLALIGQFALGVITVLTGVPVALGVLHQAGALVVFAAAIVAAHALRQHD